MTYSLTTSGDAGTRKQTFETAEAAVTKIDKMRDSATRLKVSIDSEAATPSDLTESERLIILKEGRSAAAEGRSAEECPYEGGEVRHALWQDGYRGQEF